MDGRVGVSGVHGIEIDLSIISCLPKLVRRAKQNGTVIVSAQEDQRMTTGCTCTPSEFRLACHAVRHRMTTTGHRTHTKHTYTHTQTSLLKDDLRKDLRRCVERRVAAVHLLHHVDAALLSNDMQGIRKLKNEQVKIFLITQT